jgi:hypothetical protein
MLGVGFLTGTHLNLQSIAFSAVCFMFLSFPLISCIGSKLFKKSNLASNDNSQERSDIGFQA